MQASDRSPPLPSRGEKLPPPPPPDLRDSLIIVPPPPPPKIMQNVPDPSSPMLHSSNLAQLQSNSLDIDSSIPLTPITPLTPSFSAIDAKPKKINPLNDLIDTEKSYVDQLTGIIRKVAAAWSRSNLPPTELDVMFRSIEAVYKANRNLYSKLRDIGANPSSPKALGDLLMRWIDDLDGPYTTYCTKFCSGFDQWDPVQSNPKLATTLTTFSASTPPPISASSIWTLDTLFLLPKARLKYYRKLYARLLKSTAPGRSDHKLLVGALDKLDRLLDTLEHRSSIIVGQDAGPVPPIETEDEVVIDMGFQTLSPHKKPITSPHYDADSLPGDDGSSTRGSSFSEGDRFMRDSSNTTISRGSNSTLSMPISDLERRLSTARTLDVFTMKPKVVKLSMAPTNLTFTRELRLSMDVIIRFTPRATGVETVHRHGHIFLLSDLFLICERMTSEEQAQNEGADMWLCYPPLSGKVLRVSDVNDQENAFQVAIMRKEFLILETESTETCRFVVDQFKDCIEFSGSLPPPSKQPPPPVPPLNFSGHANGNGQQMRGSGGGGMNPSFQRTESPPANVNGDSTFRSQPPPAYQNSDARLSDTTGRIRMPSDRTEHDMHSPPPLRTSTSVQPYTNSPGAFGPGQVAPPPRSTSFMGQADSLPAGPSYQYNPNPPHGLPNSSGPNQSPFSVNRRHSPFGMAPINTIPPHSGLPPRPPSEPAQTHNGIHKTPSTRSLASQYSQNPPTIGAPPMPAIPGGYGAPIPRNNSLGALHAPQPRPMLPSVHIASRQVSYAEPAFTEPSPPGSPVEETPPHTGPVISTVSAQMKCKVFLQQQHAQWKSLGSAKLKLYRQDPTNIKQLVVETDNKDKAILISTIVLTDGVERVGKTGVAIELSDHGARTGIVYMIQLRNEQSAGGLFDSLLAGSDRSRR